MTNIVDLRSRKLLEYILETGNVDSSRERAGISKAEFSEFMQDSTFDLTVTQCQLEWVEDQFREIQNNLQREMDEKIDNLRSFAMQEYFMRHPGKSHG